MYLLGNYSFIILIETYVKREILESHVGDSFSFPTLPAEEEKGRWLIPLFLAFPLPFLPFPGVRRNYTHTKCPQE